LLGSGFGLLVTYALIVVIVGGAGQSDKLQISFSSALFFGLVLISNAMLFIAIGAVTSQLGATRRRAILYGAAPLAIFFVLRGLGNAAPNLYWVKNLT